ncbi:hypothetical protein Ccrd_018099 [Cynara cardunculus var. scolymus]|uniref:Uncharacterized protein n=1 Tax=Cynara cardunculus var. scolymus TaxID=59895 RepID=A0A103Y6W4_CYNCS|nr:hypothetical protein Ccrd_018099 [Cynara cardunculus var. scolymus]
MVASEWALTSCFPESVSTAASSGSSVVTSWDSVSGCGGDVSLMIFPSISTTSLILGRDLGFFVRHLLARQESLWADLRE